MASFTHEYTVTVSSSSTSSSDYTPANGERLHICHMGGAAVHSNEVKVEVLWDSTVVFVTHGDLIRPACAEYTGDGSKKLTIKFTNDSGSEETLTGFVLGESYV